MILFLTTIIPLTANDVNGIIDYGTTIVGDLMPLIIIILGIGIGLWIFKGIMK